MSSKYIKASPEDGVEFDYKQFINDKLTVSSAQAEFFYKVVEKSAWRGLQA